MLWEGSFRGQSRLPGPTSGHGPLRREHRGQLLHPESRVARLQPHVGVFEVVPRARREEVRLLLANALRGRRPWRPVSVRPTRARHLPRPAEPPAPPAAPPRPPAARRRPLPRLRHPRLVVPVLVVAARPAGVSPGNGPGTRDRRGPGRRVRRRWTVPQRGEVRALAPVVRPRVEPGARRVRHPRAEHETRAARASDPRPRPALAPAPDLREGGGGGGG